MADTKPLYKAYDMEELLDIWFFHPIGFEIAKFAAGRKMTAMHVTYFGMAAGMAGGSMLARPLTAFAGIMLMIFSSILDSADGQLARMTGQTSLLGRILDGVTGYLMFACAYIGLALWYTSEHPGAYWIFGLMIAAGISTALQSSLYDYYRTAFAKITASGRIADDEKSEELAGAVRFLYDFYGSYQKMFAGSHIKLMDSLCEKYPRGILDEKGRETYKQANIHVIHGWNMLGDNMRLAAAATAVFMNNPEWYFFFIIGTMNAVMAVMIFIQARVDSSVYRRF